MISELAGMEREMKGGEYSYIEKLAFISHHAKNPEL